MLESGSSGSVRGVLSNEHPYREPGPKADISSQRIWMLRRARSGRAPYENSLVPKMLLRVKFGLQPKGVHYAIPMTLNPSKNAENQNSGI